jgi:hypothetical protein
MYTRYMAYNGEEKYSRFSLNLTRFNPRQQSRIVTWVANNTLDKKIPVCPKGRHFSSLSEFLSVPWIKVRKVLAYEAHVQT